MSRASMNPKHGDPESVRRRIADLISNFEVELHKEELRDKVLALIPIMSELRNLGKALIPSESASAARDRVLFYLQKYQGLIIKGDELLIVSGIQEYARRLRELRVQFGWPIASGVTISEMAVEENAIADELRTMLPNEYILLSSEQDRDAAHRWNVANQIRKQPGAVRDRILSYMRANIGQQVTNEEIRYVAGNKTEWARRVRELRTEYGWPIVTKNTGRPDLPIGTYIMESDRQSPEHDRRIPDDVRRAVLRRDEHKCQACGWMHFEWNPSDPRHLELHHKHHHAKGGLNVESNLITLCTVCHDREHRLRK